jgi:hypothetical protein
LLGKYKGKKRARKEKKRRKKYLAKEYSIIEDKGCRSCTS